jgi:hypothetical protein
VQELHEDHARGESRKDGHPQLPGRAVTCSTPLQPPRSSLSPTPRAKVKQKMVQQIPALAQLPVPSHHNATFVARDEILWRSNYKNPRLSTHLLELPILTTPRSPVCQQFSPARALSYLCVLGVSIPPLTNKLNHPYSPPRRHFSPKPNILRPHRPLQPFRNSDFTSGPRPGDKTLKLPHSAPFNSQNSGPHSHESLRTTRPERNRSSLQGKEDTASLHRRLSRRAETSELSLPRSSRLFGLLSSGLKDYSRVRPQTTNRHTTGRG